MKYIENIRTLSAIIKFICTTFKNRHNKQPWRVLLPCFAASANQYYILRKYTKRGKPEVDIEGTTDNTMSKRKKGQKPMIDNMLHRKQKIEQHESQQKCLNARVSAIMANS